MRCLLPLALLAVGACSEAPPSAPAAGVARFADADPHGWVGTAPWHYPVHGIDVSRYQGEIDWERVGAAGISFAYIKATEGGDVLDVRFAENWAGAGRAGVPRGAYHFYYFCRTAAEQAAWFARHVPRDRAALPPVLDMEWNHRSRTCPVRPETSAIRREMGVFLDALGRHYGQRPIIYTTVDFYRENELWRFEGYDFWLRSVADHPAGTYPGQRWAFWQYTSTGIVPGIDGPTDINVFGGSPEQWRAWIASIAG